MLSALLRFTLTLLLVGVLFPHYQGDRSASVKQIHVSADRNETARRPSTEYHLRYTRLTSFGFDTLDDGIRSGFTHWQHMCPDLAFQATDRLHLVVRFVEPSEWTTS